MASNETVPTVDRRGMLVEAAFSSIASEGLEGLRLRGVADMAGIDHSTLHHYFATKQDLIKAVVERAIAPLRETMPAEPVSDPLRAHLKTLAEMMTTDPELFVVLSEVDLRCRRDPEVRAIVEAVEAGWRSELGSVFDGSENAVELVIASVKGLRLNMPAAGGALELLADRLAPMQSEAS
jgi:AcrR family transcriptional regulator